MHACCKHILYPCHSFLLLSPILILLPYIFLSHHSNYPSLSSILSHSTSLSPSSPSFLSSAGMQQNPEDRPTFCHLAHKLKSHHERMKCASVCSDDDLSDIEECMWWLSPAPNIEELILVHFQLYRYIHTWQYLAGDLKRQECELIRDYFKQARHRPRRDHGSLSYWSEVMW